MYYHYRNKPPLDQYNRSRANVMKVSGEGKVSVQPDKAEISLGVSTEDDQLLEAQQNNASVVTKIKTALHNIGIADEQIQTTNYSIYPQYDFVDGKQIFRGYKVEHILSITVDQIENTGLVVDTAVASGANNVSRIKFGVADYRRHYQQALSKAVIDSSLKAETIANTLRVQLIKTPLSVAEGPFESGGPVPLQMNAFVKSEVSTPIQSGTIEILSRVTAEYAYYY